MGELIKKSSGCRLESMNFRQLDPKTPDGLRALKSLIWWENNPDYVPNAHLSDRVETDFLNYSWKCEDPFFGKKIDELLELIPFKGNSKIEEKRKHIEGIVTFLYLKSLTSAKWVGYWRKKTAYSIPRGSECKRSRYETVTNYSYNYTITTVDYLHENGYIDMELGEWGRGRGNGNISRMRATRKLSSLFEGVDIKTIYPASESIILRTNDEITGKKKKIEYVDDNYTKSARTNVKLINEVLRQHSYSLYLPDSVPKGTIDFLRRKAPFLDITDTFLCRKFVDDFESGGRFYGGFWQNLPNRIIPFRSRIRIDGEPATEIDYSSYHVAMAYNIFEKIPTPVGELYYIPGFSNDDNCRKFAKQTLLRTFNVASRGELRNSIAGDIIKGELKLPSEVWTVKSYKSYNSNDIYMVDGLGYFEFDDAIDRVLSHHPKLAGTMFNQIGRKLQFLDSQLAEKILLIFAKEGKPCLPLHDSFVVKRSDRSFLKHVMITEYEKMFGFPIEVDVEF
ncbi:hypothetical protein [Desulfogranum japonicum]|uniref:hypothetical protein n=1 Tax=Desulfogranum japonicum TaxID=231447 RepID=UPI000416DF80|nr:hypothetical protein [Desulfogranum japonicum]